MDMIEAYTHVENKLAKFKEILKSGDHVAGISVNIDLGALHNTDEDFLSPNLGVEISDPEAAKVILGSVIEGLEESLKIREYFIKTEEKKLREFMDENKMERFAASTGD